MRGRDDDKVDGRVLDEHLVVVESVWDVELRGERGRGLLLAAGDRDDLEVVENSQRGDVAVLGPPGRPSKLKGRDSPCGPAWQFSRAQVILVRCLTVAKVDSMVLLSCHR